MFYPQGGKEVLIQEGFIGHLPPVPDKHLIIGINQPHSEQYWKRQQIPDHYQKLFKEESERQAEDDILVRQGKKSKIFIDQHLEQYRRQEWWRRRHGVWFMNDGEPTYLTRDHYWYLQWCQYDHKINDGYPLYYEFSRDNFYFREWCELNPFSLGTLMVASRGTGKCFGKGTKVMMFEGGFKLVEDVVVGDLLMGPDSRPRKVLNLSRGVGDLFEVVQNRGMNYTATGNHVLSLKRNSGDSFLGKMKNGRFTPRFPQYGRIANMPVTDFIKKSKSFKNVFSGYKVGIDYERKNITINPYFLGMWLGDGSAQYPRITTMDKPIVSWLEHFCESENLKLSRVAESPTNPEVASYTLIGNNSRSSKNHLLDRMRDYDLIDNKHIPFSYLYNTREVRLKLLAGLLDTDGYYDRGHYEIVQVRKNLAEQILILVNSLGCRGSIGDKIINGTTYYRVGFSGKINIPVLLDRKVNRGAPNKDISLTHIDSVNYMGAGNYYGFEVDKDHLFCLEDGTVTHNSNEEIAVVSNRATYYHKHHVAIQGKHHDDSKEFIEKKIVPLFNALPKFFKPEYSHGTNAQNELVFTRKSTSGKNTKDLEFGRDDELQSSIYAAQPGEKVLDRSTLGDVLNTEVGKTDKAVADVYERLLVQQKTVVRNHLKVGMIRSETTVEEMDKGGKECEKWWKASDHRILDANGWTKSKTHRRFISALDTDTSLISFRSGGVDYEAPCNKHGKVSRMLANIKIQADLDGVKHDLKELSARMRKSPRNETEAFIPDQSKSIFNVQALTTRLHQIRHEMPNRPYSKGNFYWVDGVKFGRVWWKPDEHAGRFRCAWMPDEFHHGIKEPGKNKIVNNWKKEWGYNIRTGRAEMLVIPGNDHLFRAGTDPIKYVFTKDARASKAAIHVFRMFDGMIDGGGKPASKWQSHNFIFEYCERPENTETYLEDMAMICMFLGCKVFPERNVPDVNKYFEQNGLQNLLSYPKEWIQYDPEQVLPTSKVNEADAGLAASKLVIDFYTKQIIPYINDHISRCPFDDTIEDWLKFDPLSPTTSHMTVSSGFALMHATKKAELEDRPPEDKLSDWFDSADNSGMTGVLIDSED